MKNNELKALITLLDDPDPEIYDHVRDQIKSKGLMVIPSLESAWSSSLNAILQERIEEVIHDIQFSDLKIKFKKWKHQGVNADLLEAMILVAKYQYPDFNENVIKNQLEEYRNKLIPVINAQKTPLEKIRILNYYFYQVWGFKGNTKNYHAPQNSYINDVLERKKGNPLLLSVVYLLIAQSVSMPVYGVNLPQHFVVSYIDVDDVFSNIDPISYPKVLFYVNTFNNGAIFSIKEINDFIIQLKLKPHSSFYYPCTNLEIIERVFNNLLFSYKKIGDEEKIKEINTLKKAIGYSVV